MTELRVYANGHKILPVSCFDSKFKAGKITHLKRGGVRQTYKLRTFPYHEIQHQYLYLRTHMSMKDPKKSGGRGSIVVLVTSHESVWLQ